MARDNSLIPVFMPPLATLLAHAEKVKNSPLTETEVVRLRDNAPCIMMKVEDADKLIETRGYRDVNPENCWADWHRLRPELTGNGFLPKIVLCLPGSNGFSKNGEAILLKSGNEHEWRKREKRMTEAFQASEFRAQPSLEEQDWELIDQHKTVLYILSANYTSGQAPTVSQRMLQLGRQLLEAGGVAIKCESSGIAHSRARWIELANEADNAKNAHAFWSALFDAFVQMPISNDDGYYTCGMHLLGKPDLIVNSDILSATDAIDLFAAFALYLLAECPEGSFASGHTFSEGKNAPRYTVEWEPCTDYDEDDFFFNPFGRWRFTSPESQS